MRACLLPTGLVTPSAPDYHASVAQDAGTIVLNALWFHHVYRSPDAP